MKKTIIVLTTIVMIISMVCVFVSCKDKTKQVELKYYEDSEFGLFFYGENHDALYNRNSNDYELAGTIDMVRAKDAVSNINYFDPEKPTVIWVHGWEPDATPTTDYVLCLGGDTQKNVSDLDNMSYPKYLRELGYNVATFNYCGDGSTKNYANSLANIYYYAFASVDGYEESLAYLFASELCLNLKDYTKEITYVGHSCGSFVTLAVNNMVAYFITSGAVTNKNLLASKIHLADPYINTIGDTQFEYIYATNEAVNGRKKVEVCQDIICNLYDKYSVPTVVYLGMSVASSEFKTVDTDRYNNVASKSIIVDMTGLQSKYEGFMGSGGVHVVTRDWVLQSIMSDKLKDQNGDLAPSAKLTKDELLSLVGNQYKQVNKSLKLSTDSMTKVDSLI